MLMAYAGFQRVDVKSVRTFGSTSVRTYAQKARKASSGHIKVEFERVLPSSDEEVEAHLPYWSLSHRTIRHWEPLCPVTFLDKKTINLVTLRDQVIAVKRGRRSWNAKAASVPVIRRSHLLDAERSKEVGALELQETSGLLWVESTSDKQPEDVRDIVPNRGVAWTCQVVAVDAECAQELVSSPLGDPDFAAALLRCCEASKKGKGKRTLDVQSMWERLFLGTAMDVQAAFAIRRLRAGGTFGRKRHRSVWDKLSAVEAKTTPLCVELRQQTPDILLSIVEVPNTEHRVRLNCLQCFIPASETSTRLVTGFWAEKSSKYKVVSRRVEGLLMGAVRRSAKTPIVIPDESGKPLSPDLWLDDSCSVTEDAAEADGSENSGGGDLAVSSMEAWAGPEMALKPAALSEPDTAASSSSAAVKANVLDSMQSLDDDGGRAAAQNGNGKARDEASVALSAWERLIASGYADARSEEPAAVLQVELEGHALATSARAAQQAQTQCTATPSEDTSERASLQTDAAQGPTSLSSAEVAVLRDRIDALNARDAASVGAAALPALSPASTLLSGQNPFSDVAVASVIAQENGAHVRNEEPEENRVDRATALGEHLDPTRVAGSERKPDAVAESLMASMGVEPDMMLESKEVRAARMAKLAPPFQRVSHELWESLVKLQRASFARSFFLKAMRFVSALSLLAVNIGVALLTNSVSNSETGLYAVFVYAVTGLLLFATVFVDGQAQRAKRRRNRMLLNLS